LYYVMSHILTTLKKEKQKKEHENFRTLRL